MNASKLGIQALWIIGALVVISSGCAHTASPARERPSAVEASEPVAEMDAPEPSVVAEQQPELAKAEPAKRVVRRIKGSEMTVPVVKKARQIIDEHYKKPFGYEVEFELEGKRYVGRIEPHYHPPGGELRPWGHHAGCSLYVVEQG